MATDREKLVELISSVEYKSGWTIGERFYRDWIEMVADQLIAKGVTVQNWRDAKTDPPNSGEHVLLCCAVKRPDGSAGSRYVCDGFYAAKFTEIVTNCGDDIAYEYSEKDDQYFLLEGWYEVVKNWDEYSSIVISDFVVGWQPLPGAEGSVS